MRYFVAHLLGGEARAYHERLSRELSLRFHTEPLFEKSPPHITIKPPFDTDEAGIEDVERVLRAFARSERAAPLRISGFGRFGFRTIYLDVLKSPEAVSLIRRALSTLNGNIPSMPAYPLEGNKPHAAIARFLTRRQYRHIWRHLSGMRAEFSLTLDHIAILKKENKKWDLHASIPLRMPEDDSGYALLPSAAEADERPLLVL